MLGAESIWRCPPTAQPRCLTGSAWQRRPGPRRPISASSSGSRPAPRARQRSPSTTFGPEQFTIRGPTGVHIQLGAFIAGAHRERNSPYPVVGVGRTVQITGTTNPKVVDARLQIGYRSTTGARRGTIGTVTTDRLGAFRIGWKPPSKGTYTITSSYRHPAPGLMADDNCNLALSVK